MRREMASAASKRPGAREVLRPPVTFSHALNRLPNAETGPWRLCAGKGCRKAGRCRGGAEQCPEDIESRAVWLREAWRAGCAGASPRAAVRIADRHVLAMLGGAHPRRAANTK
jgi:hypothetical protein